MMQFDKKTANIVFGRPIPGQSLTDKYRNSAWQSPPQHVELDKALDYLFDKLTERYQLKQLLHIFDSGMSVEAITRTILFTGFTQGKWTPTLMMMLYRPLLLLIATLAHKAGHKDLPVIEPSNFKDYHVRQMHMHTLAKMNKDKKPVTTAPSCTCTSPSQAPVKAAASGGFMTNYIPMRGE